MLSKNRYAKAILKLVAVAVLLFFFYLMFLASAFAFMAVPVLMLLSIAVFFTPGHSFSERVFNSLRAFVMAPVTVLGLSAPWRAVMVITHLTCPALVAALYPMVDRGFLFIPFLETAYGFSGAVLAVLFGFKSLSTYIKFIRVTENLPRSMAGSAAVGLAEFSGVVRSVTDSGFVLEDKSGRIRVELPKVNPWSPSDIFPMPDKKDFMKVYFTRRGSGEIADGDPVYVVGMVEIDRSAAPGDAGSARLVVRPSSGKTRIGLAKRFLFFGYDRYDMAEDYHNIFIVTDRPESTARSLLRRGMFTSFGMTALFLALSLSLIYVDLTRGADVRDRVLRGVASIILKVPDENRPPWLPAYRTLPDHERTGARPLVHLDFDDGIINKGSAQNTMPGIAEIVLEKALTWQEELYERLFPERLKVRGVFGQTIEFEGNRIVDILNGSRLSSSGSFTVEFWFMLKNTGKRPAPALEHLFVSDLFSLSVRGHGGEMTLHAPCFGSSGELADRSTHDLDIKRLMPSGLTPGLWHHFRAVHDGSMLDVGINGRSFIGVPRYRDRKGMYCSMVPQEVRELKLGGSELGKDSFVGQIDEFYFYDYARIMK